MRPSVLRIVLALAALAGPAAAQSLRRGDRRSGLRRRRLLVGRGRREQAAPPRPLVATPDTLCADLAPQPGTPTTQIDIYPMITPQVGPGGGGIPYEGGSVRPYRP
ncbi:hypothetical protein ACU4GA_07365 [Methylobacterium oryzae CBMB20]